MEPLTLAALAALAVKVTSALKYLTSGAWREAATQAVTWGAGIGVVALAAQADLSSGIAIGDVALGSLDFPSQILVGISLGSLGSFGYDIKKAVDGSDSAHEPPLASR